MSKRKQVWQRHHITYASTMPTPERVVRVTRGEHWTITQLQRFKSLSPGCVQAILAVLADKPLNLEEPQ